MNPHFRKVALVAASLGLLVSLFLALRPDDEDAAPATTAPATTATAPATTPTTTAAATTNQTTTDQMTTEAAEEPVLVDIDAGSGKIARVKVDRGRRVVLTVSADVADSVHLHGYDLQAGVAPGRPAKLSFRAERPGVFELELEERGAMIAELTVEP